MENELSNEAIIAIAGVLTIVLGGLGWGSKRAATNAVAPVSANAEATAPMLFLDTKRVDTAISQMGVVEAALKTAAEAFDRAAKEVVAGVGVDTRVKQELIEALRENTKTCQQMLRSVDEARDEIKDMTRELIRSGGKH